MPTMELRVTGKVQGVFYRDSTRKKAMELGLAGWVRNEPDGSVTVKATGPADALDELESWCAAGPAKAKVIGVSRTNLADEVFSGFAIIR